MDYQGGAYGVAVLSRTPIGRVTNRRLPGSPEREPRTALTVDVETTERRSRVQFTTTHLDQGRDSDGPGRAGQRPRHRVGGRHPRHPCWRLNTRPDTLTMQILARRWTDTMAEPPPDPSGRPRRRIDYVMVAPAAAWRTLESRYLDAPLASDHQPVLTVLEWIGTTGGASRVTR